MKALRGLFEEEEIDEEKVTKCLNGIDKTCRTFKRTIIALYKIYETEIIVQDKSKKEFEQKRQLEVINDSMNAYLKKESF